MNTYEYIDIYIYSYTHIDTYIQIWIVKSYQITFDWLCLTSGPNPVSLRLFKRSIVPITLFFCNVLWLPRKARTLLEACTTPEMMMIMMFT
jgi:hypothetical protein